MRRLNEIFWISDMISLKFFIGVYWKYVSIGPDGCLMTNGQQAIIWASDSLIYWRIYASFQLRHFLFQIKISKKCVHLGIVENMLILEQIMAWHQSGNMALFEPMMAEFTDPYASFDWKLKDFKQNVIQLCSLGPDWEYFCIGSDNGVVPNRRQAIVWSNCGLNCIYIYICNLGHNCFRQWLVVCIYICAI